MVCIRKCKRAAVKRAFGIVGVLILACLTAGAARAADKPLTQDDVTLLLLGGATTQKMLTLIEQRGIDFRMTPDLAMKFHDAGADDIIIEALQKAGAKVRPATAATPPSPSATNQGQASLAQAPAATPTGSRATASEGLAGEEQPLAPAFSLVDLSGQRVNLADYKGQVVVVNFWATWCPRCRAAIPRLVELQDKYRNQGLQVIGLSVDEGPRAVRQYFQMQHVNYPVAMADWKVRQNYGGISGVPTSFLIGRDGRMYFRLVGVPDGEGLSSYLEPEVRLLLNTPAGGGVPRPAEAGATRVASGEATPVPPAPTGSAGAPKLTDPSPDEIQKIIQEFAAKEKLFKEARNNYAYHQINRLNELDADGNVVGTYHEEWDILYDDNGKRIERVTYAPERTLKRIGVTKEDLDAMRNIQPFVLTTDELPEYDIKYLGHVKVDEITAYVFSIRPKEILKNRLYFQGTVWVDDRDLQIVKSEGKSVPETKTKGGENLFPRFTTYREQIDGKYWFPTFTLADDTLYFATGAVPIKQTIRYTDYKQFRSKVRILSASPVDTPVSPPGPK